MYVISENVSKYTSTLLVLVLVSVHSQWADHSFTGFN